MSQPPPPFPEPIAGRAFAWLPLVAAAVVFGGFLGYGLLAPATYRATAQIVLKPIGSAKVALPSAPSPVERLRLTVHDPEALERVANALELGTGEAGQAAAKVHLDARLAVTAPRADTFEFAFDESTAERAERAANLVARHAATRTQNALTPPPPDEVTAREAARSKSAQELAAFMALHPELNPSTPSVVPVPPKDPKEASDADGSALRAERDQIRAKLAQMPAAGDDSDNPFGEVNAAEGKRMRRRLAEIEQTLVARKRADKKNESAPKVAPEVEREWKRLLAATANPVVAERQAPPPTFTVMLREATRPSAPIEPDRRLLAVLGVIASLVTALGLSVIQGKGARKRPGAAAPARAQYGSDPPRPRSEPPRQGSEPPRAGSEPPRQESEPPRAGSDPPRTSSAPPRPASDPPRPGSEPPLHASSSPPGLGQTVALPPQQILSIADTVISPAAPRPASSNPPAEAHRSNNQPAETHRSSNPPVPTTTAPLLSPPPQVATAVGHPRPSPPPEAPSPPPARPTPGYEELGKLAPAPAVAKGTLLGMAPIDPRALAAAEDPEVNATEGPFAPAPSVREANEPRSTLRPPPPGPSAAPAEPAAARGQHRPEAPATATHLAPQAGEPDSSWTGPSRAHRRSMSAARRTTQMLGSPIPPVTRGGSSSRPPNERREQDERRDGSDPPPPQPTTYSFVSTRPPEAPSPRPATNTPPYYAQPEGGSNRRHPASTPHPPAPAARAPAPRPRVTKHPLRAGWTPEVSIDARLRRSLADELFPLAIEECLVVGVTSVGETRLQKSRVAAELALALAEPRHPRVLLLEGDFQSATLHRVMRIDMPLAAGFSQQLRAMGRSVPESWTVVEVSPTLHVLTEGIMRSPGLILSVQFEESIRSLRSYYDLIVLDGPDSSSEVECRALSNVIDAVVLVAPASGSPDLARASLLFPEKRYSTVVGV